MTNTDGRSNESNNNNNGRRNISNISISSLTTNNSSSSTDSTSINQEVNDIMLNGGNADIDIGNMRAQYMVNLRRRYNAVSPSASDEIEGTANSSVQAHSRAHLRRRYNAVSLPELPFHQNEVNGIGSMQAQHRLDLRRRCSTISSLTLVSDEHEVTGNGSMRAQQRADLRRRYNTMSPPTLPSGESESSLISDQEVSNNEQSLRNRCESCRRANIQPYSYRNRRNMQDNGTQSQAQPQHSQSQIVERVLNMFDELTNHWEATGYFETHRNNNPEEPLFLSDMIENTERILSDMKELVIDKFNTELTGSVPRNDSKEEFVEELTESINGNETVVVDKDAQNVSERQAGLDVEQLETMVDNEAEFEVESAPMLNGSQKKIELESGPMLNGSQEEFEKAQLAEEIRKDERLPAEEN